MTHIICIETATPVCSIALVSNGTVVGLKESDRKNSHAKMVGVFIQQLLSEAGLKASDLVAVAVSKGPGSYTGLRIGVSTAKGLCYALSIPLLAINTLRLMATGLITKLKNEKIKNTLFCPMIDAKRMEVYCAIYDSEGNEQLKTNAVIVDNNTFNNYLEKQKMIVFGDGAEKCKPVITHPNVEFVDDFRSSAAFMHTIAFQKYKDKTFEDVAYFEPFYLKDFIAGVPKVKGLY